MRELAALRHPTPSSQTRTAPGVLHLQGAPAQAPGLCGPTRPGLTQMVRQNPGQPQSRPPGLGLAHPRPRPHQPHQRPREHPPRSLPAALPRQRRSHRLETGPTHRPGLPPREHRLLRAVGEALKRRAALHAAQAAPTTGPLSATEQRAASPTPTHPSDRSRSRARAGDLPKQALRTARLRGSALAAHRRLSALNDYVSGLLTQQEAA